jgi:hypothetical protein
LKTHDFNKTIKGKPTEFNGFYQVWENFHHSVDPCEKGEVTHWLVVDPVTNFEAVGECSRDPRDVREMISFVATLALGSRPRQRGCKGAGQEEAPESHHRLSGV